MESHRLRSASVSLLFRRDRRGAKRGNKMSFEVAFCQSLITFVAIQWNIVHFNAPRSRRVIVFPFTLMYTGLFGLNKYHKIHAYVKTRGKQQHSAENTQVH